MTRYLIVLFVGFSIGVLFRPDPPKQPELVSIDCPTPAPTPEPQTPLPTPSRMDCSDKVLECYDASAQLMNKVIELQGDLERAKSDSDFWQKRFYEVPSDCD